MSVEAMKQAQSNTTTHSADCWQWHHECAVAKIEQAEAEGPECNPHPKAPHGFDRNASHTNDRYTCECEGWDAYEAGYQAGFVAGIGVEVSEEPKREPLTDEQIEAISAEIERGDFFDCVVPFARAIEAAHGIKGKE